MTRKFNTILLFSNSTFKHLTNYCNNYWTLSWFTHQEQNHKTRMTIHAPVASCHVCPMGIHQIYLTLYRLSSRAWAMDSLGMPSGYDGKSSSERLCSFSMTQRSRMHYLSKTKGSLHEGHKSHRSFQLESSENWALHFHYHLTNYGTPMAGSYNQAQSMGNLMILGLLKFWDWRTSWALWQMICRVLKPHQSSHF